MGLLLILTTRSAMRVVVLALALALVAGHEKLAPRFTTGQTYVYQYLAETMGGLPEQGLARVGLKLSSQVKISALQENLILLKLENPELLEYSDVWPKDSFNRIQFDEEIRNQLQIPIKFKYEQGIVRQVQAPKSVSTEVLNIHRGILNILQLNIKETQNVYELQEEGTQGVCKTEYVITENENAERLLTKSIDLNHCQEKVKRNIGLAYTKTCLKCQEISKSLRGTTGYSYRLKKVSGGTLIKEASGEELIQISPFNELNGAATMNTTQQLVYVNVERSAMVPNSNMYEDRGSLKYKFPTDLLQSPIKLMKMNDVKGQIENILTQLVEENREIVHDNAPLKFLELIQLLRSADEDQLQNLLKRYSESDHPKRRWLMDAIPNIGTEAVLEVVMKKVLRKEVSLPQATQLLIRSLHRLEPSREIIEKVWNFARDPSLQQDVYGRVVRKTLLLGFGSLIHRHCADQTVCRDDDIKRLEELIRNARDTDETVLLIKVMANSGHPWTYKQITKHLPVHGTNATALDTRVHNEAILALRSLIKHKHKEVQNQALQLYMDESIPSEARMFAVMVLFETRPSMAVVTNVVNMIKSDPSKHVASFTYSLIRSLARSIDSVHSSVVAECNVALRLLGQRRVEMKLSRAFHLSHFNHPLMLGAAASIYYINDAAKILPKAVVAKTTAYFAGAAADVFEIGLRSEGLQKYVLSQQNSDNLQLTDSANKMRRLIQSLVNWRSVPVNKMLASMYVKVLGQEIAFIDIDKQVIDEAIKLNTETDIKQHALGYLRDLFQKGISTRFVKAVVPSEIRSIMPSATGLPIELALYTAAVTATDVQAKINSNLDQEFHLPDIMRAKIDIDTEIKPSIAINTYAVMGINSKLTQTAIVSKAKVQVNAPAKIRGSMDFVEGNFKISAHPVTLPENIAVNVDADTHAVAIKSARRTPLIPDNTSDQRLNPTSAASDLNNMQGQNRQSSQLRASQSDKKYCTDSAGLRSCLRIATRNAKSLKNSALYRLAGKHHARLTFKQSETEVVEKWEMELQFGQEGKRRLVKINSLDLEEITEGTPVLTKLKRILSPNLKNESSSSSSSHSSSHSQSSDSSSSSSSSSSRVTARVVKAVGKILGGKHRSHSSSGSSSSSRRSHKNQRSTVSSLESLLSSGSAQDMSQHDSARGKFNPNHQKKNAKHNSGSASSGQSMENIREQKKFLGESNPTIFVLILRAVRADNKQNGYEIAAYQDKEQKRIQVILSARAPENHWKLVADAIELSKHKVATKISWGQKTLKYNTMITAETGQVQEKMAARVRVAWKKLPSSLVKDVKLIYKHILVPYLSPEHLQKRSTDNKQISFTVVAESEKTLKIIMKSPRRVYRQNVQLPINLPINELNGEMPFDSALDNAHYLFAKTTSTQCSLHQNHIKTFNNRDYEDIMSRSCLQVLVQDCSNNPEFVVLLKKDRENKHVITVKIGRDDIDLHQQNGRPAVTVNNQDVDIERRPYFTESGNIKIELKNSKLVLYALRSGIAELQYDPDNVVVHIADRMRNNVCGLCGQGNGDDKRDYRTPNGQVTQKSASFAQAWTVPSKGCNDETGCRVELVSIEEQAQVHGEQSRCQSINKVLQCISECSPSRKVTIDTDFQCEPIHGGSVAQGRSQRVDLTKQVEAHLECNCPSNC